MTTPPMQQPDADCVFCGIVRGDLPAAEVGRDDRTIAFLDINPATPGHLLVVPKAHAVDLLTIEPDDLAACAVAAQRLAQRAVDVLGADGVNLVNCSGAAAWQTVFHFHLHVVPRYADDPARDALQPPWVPTPGDPSALEDLASRLKQH